MSSTTPTPTGTPRVRPGALKRWLRRIRIFLLLLPLLFAAALGLYVVGALHFSYSTGDRAGYVQKFSRKGWLCKTWEGELAMVSLPGTAPEIFPFSVRDEAIAVEINRHIGERLALTYEQHKGVPSCFAESEYFVVKVRPLQH
jgi:hypothetical protein